MNHHQHRPKVVVLDDYQGVATDLGPWEQLEDRIDLEVLREHIADDDELVERVADAEVLVVMRERTPLNRERLERLPNLRLIVTKGMFNASIDTEAATRLGMTVSGSTGRREPPVELAWALILALARHLCEEDRRMRDGGWQQTIGTELYGRTLGIIGLGRLGSKVAAIGQAFGMNVIAWSQNLLPETAEEIGVTAVTKRQLLETSDFVTLQTKLSDRTRGLISTAEFEAMRPTTYLINTSRGPLVDESALLTALRSGTIAGAGLDVYDVEPLPPDHPLRSMPNVVLSPHLGYVSIDGYRRYFTQAVEDVRTWLDGDPVRVIAGPA